MEALLRDGGDLFDGALVCLPNNTSPDADATGAGGQTYPSGKPGAANAADAHRMAEAVRTAVAFQAGYMWRYEEGAN